MRNIFLTIILSISMLAMTSTAWSETYTYDNGDKYVGEYKDDEMHGRGTYTYDNGDKYIGEYKDNKRHGQGTYTFADGEVWQGLWENGEFEGKK